MGFYATFANLTKAFDTVSRRRLWQILERLGCPRKFLNIVNQLHEGQRGQIRLEGVGVLPQLQWSKAGFRPGTDSFQHLLQHDAKTG